MPRTQVGPLVVGFSYPIRVGNVLVGQPIGIEVSQI